MALSIPVRLANGAGNLPDAAGWMDDFDWQTSIGFGLAFIANGGMELWAAGTSFSNPTNGTTLADNWSEVKSGITPCTADVTREASVIDTGVYSMKVNITGAGSSDSYWAIKQSVSTPAAFGSLTVVAGVKIKVSTASKVRIKVYDGSTSAFSSFHTGDGTWQLLQAKLVCQTTPSEVTVTIEINPANFTDAVYMDSTYLYVVPSAISARSQTALVYSPLGSAGIFLPITGGTLTGNLIFSSGKGVKGTITNDNAAAGNVGEYVESVVSGVSYTSATYTNITTISLTAGDWDVTGMIVGQGGSTNTNGPNISIISLFSGATATDHVIGDNMQYWAGNPAVSTSHGGNVPKWRLSLSGTTTVYLKLFSTYSGGTPTAWGKLCARRTR